MNYVARDRQDVSTACSRGHEEQTGDVSSGELLAVYPQQHTLAMASYQLSAYLSIQTLLPGPAAHQSD